MNGGLFTLLKSAFLNQQQGSLSKAELNKALDEVFGLMLKMRLDFKLILSVMLKIS